MTKNLSYYLVLLGGIVTLGVAILAGFFSTSAVLSSIASVNPVFASIAGAVVGIYAVWGAIVGLLTIWSADVMRKGGPQAHTGMVVGVVCSVLALVTLEGLILGPVMSLVGTAVKYGESRKKR